MDQLAALGTSINEIVMPTYKIYMPLLLQNEDAIRSVKRETHSYGPNERQQLDIYHAPTPLVINGRRPVLVFVHGGGFIRGSKIVPESPKGLVYANLGAFFALKCGFTVVVIDYRLVFEHKAKFASGGEDIALAVEWVCANEPDLGSEPIDLFLLGNSAGGCHAASFLFHADFTETRKKISTGHGTRLRGVIFLGTPFHFNESPASRTEILKEYYGDDWYALSPLGQLKGLRAQKKPIDFLQGTGARVLVIDCDLDPVEALQPRDDFIKEWLEFESWETRLALSVDNIAGHNHISPPLSLCTGKDIEEAWGYQVADFCKATARLPPK